MTALHIASTIFFLGVVPTINRTLEESKAELKLSIGDLKDLGEQVQEVYEGDSNRSIDSNEILEFVKTKN